MQIANEQAKTAHQHLDWLTNWSDTKDCAEKPSNYISGKGVDHYKRYIEDFDILSKLHLNSFRFGIEWSRLEPEEGTGKDNNKATVKGNIDAELVLYAMKEMPNYSSAIIVSGDGDFYCLAEYLENKGRLKAIMTPNWKYSTLLKPYEKYIVRLDQKRGQLEHYDKPRKKRYASGKKTKKRNN